MHPAMENYLKAVFSAWNTASDQSMEEFQRWPLISPAPQTETVEVITLGLNPSYVEDVLKNHWEEVQKAHGPFQGQWPHAMIWHRSLDGKVDDDLFREISLLDAHSRESYQSYYKPIQTLVNLAKPGVPWYHFDLFPIRETNQKGFTSKIRVPKNAAELAALRAAAPGSNLKRSYDWDQTMVQLFDAAVRLIEELQPKVVVVLNSYVSRLLGYKLELHKQTNGHRYGCEKLPEVVFLLGSQLSGGATSIYGRERLLADLRDVLRGQKGMDGGGEEWPSE